MVSWFVICVLMNDDDGLVWCVGFGEQVMDVVVYVVEFWKEVGFVKWFVCDDVFDVQFCQLFLDEYFVVVLCGCEYWLGSVEGVLVLMLLLDQFLCNCFRGIVYFYVIDGLVWYYVMCVIEEGLDLQLVLKLCVFIYLLFEYFEDLLDQDCLVVMFDVLGDKEYLQYVELYCDIICCFGCFLYCNVVLGCIFLLEELDYLVEGGFVG